jgi:hypothetical protein
MPQYMFCPRQKNNIQDFQNPRYILFLCPKENARERARVGKGKEKEREGKERESEYKSVGDYISKSPGPE